MTALSAQQIAAQLAHIVAQTPGVLACALVDGDSGLVWLRCTAGKPAAEASNEADADAALWEAAVDYWRLHSRQRAHFASLGELGAAVLYHQRGVLAILPCQRQPDVLAVCRAEHSRVDWQAWQRRVAGLAQQMRDSAL